MEQELKQIEKVLALMIDFIVNYSFQIVGAIIIVIIGVIASRSLYSFLLRFFEKRGYDPTISKFTANLAKFIILGFMIIIALGKFGITIAPFIAALTAVAFGASFAIQGPLSNYGAGLVIIISRPFVVGNTIMVKGVSGVVEEIKLGATILTDEDGVRITIPNRHIVGEVIHNSEQWRIVESKVGISYESDHAAAIYIIQKTLDEFEEISRDPEPHVGIQEFGDSSINIGFRYWLPTKKYFQILYKVNSAIYEHLKDGNIEIPFPQRVVHTIANNVKA
ncbi:MAG: mechanosensitive ion channel family protein [Deltaproteobacteria bacterium]|nr:mechanosensitive ion channel family protein [Deltaproteobacteria bacterium]